MEKIGIIAGNRKFPLLFAKEAKKKGLGTVAIAIKGDTCRSISRLVDKVYWLDLSRFSRMFDIFKSEEVTKVVMAGQISPWRLFSKEVNNDPALSALLQDLKDRRADTIFAAIASKLEEHGITLISSTLFLEDYMPKKGQLTKNAPGFDTWEDVYFGFALAKEIALLDIGQAVAVKNKAIVAVEALEGTDNLIRRAGIVGGRKTVIVKVSKPCQDLRFDVPVVGLNTIKTMIHAGCSCLAFEAGKTLFIDPEQSILLAQRNDISIVSV
ncbi:MAG: UDP-2,3-diacylglucosamine diphosphatase LpxI [Candidatus Omnitrophica bacterium]|jgi:hypothetical protein|nr:UDP-2,3-diacylglucosamine diphosphatase LpxI [Candidatus Omnitrophota bacterium]